MQDHSVTLKANGRCHARSQCDAESERTVICSKRP